MAYKIKVEKRGMKPEEFIRRVEKKLDNLRDAMAEIGEMGAVMMASFVTTGTQRQPSSGKLASAIDSKVKFGKTIDAVGIAEKSKLPPYWFVLNYGVKLDGTPFVPGGGALIPGSFGGNPPDSSYKGIHGGAGERFRKDARYSSAVKATIAIEGINYIEKTQAWMDMQWKIYIQTRMRMQ